MNKRIVLGLVCLALLFTIGCKKEGVSLVTAGLRDKPTDEKGAFNWIKGVNRGQVVKIVEEQKDSEWMRVQLADGTTEGWIQKKFIHSGKKQVLEFTEKTMLYDQPDAESKVRYNIPAGTRALVLKEKDKWYQVNINWGMDGWVRAGTSRESEETKASAGQEVYIAGIGKCFVDASSSLPDSGGYTFSVTNLFDKNPATTWQVGNGGDGEWVEITFPSPVSIYVSIINGFVTVDPKFAQSGAGGDLYILNNRVRSIDVEISGTGNERSKSTISFMDETRDYQDAGSYQDITKIRFTIDSIYRGLKWNDTALAEIKIVKQ